MLLSSSDDISYSVTHSNLSILRYYRESDRSILAHEGLDDIDRLFEKFFPKVTRHPGRHVHKETLSDGSVVFIKLQHGRQRLIPTMRELRDGRFFHSIPENEWNGLNLLRSAGLEAAEPMVLMRKGHLFYRSAIIIRSVPAPKSLKDYFEDGTWQTLSEDDRQLLRREMLHVVNTIHHAGLAWAGIAAKHLFPCRRDDGSWFYWLIDCEGVHGNPNSDSYIRDLGKLRKSLDRCHADPATLSILSKAP